jgi:hypothetical protein
VLPSKLIDEQSTSLFPALLIHVTDEYAERLYSATVRLDMAVDEHKEDKEQASSTLTFPVYSMSIQKCASYINELDTIR